jgi:eukaryotic-like serine/threonine-protein kinase
LPHDRAQRPDMSQGSDPSQAPGGHPSDRGHGNHQQMGGSLPDIRAQGGGTYFLGRYRIVDEIGIGGMASVHLARMDGPGGFQKWVAIKKIHPHLVEDESFVQMFLDEARVAARISHPNVATVFDLGKHDDTYWIAMEYLHGEPLREVMRRTEELGTAMPPEIACRVIADAAEGLHAAHELLGKNGEKLGLVHRDVTPHNLFVTYDGVTKVVDFGIAKFSSRMSHTRAGTLKGKLAYMSPEQVHGEGIDRRTDIFALGVVLWELTTGQRLFRMESDLDTLAKVQECNVPRPSTLIRGYPVDLEKIVMKALAKNRGERFRTARELSRALQSLLMRRGLFIASDEVAAYTQSIFNDRIQKREAHLRWAAEVTSTINVDQLLSKPKLGPEFTNSEVQAQQKPAGVRPAAGMPAAPITGPMAEPEPSTHQPAQMRGYSQSVPDDLKETGPLAASASPHRSNPVPSVTRGPAGNVNAANAPRSTAASVQTADPRRNGPPRPAAGSPMVTQQSPTHQPHPHGEDEEHPADGDGPTIQALPPVVDVFAGHSLGPSLREPMRSEPPTLMESAPSSQTDGPTMMANPRTRAAMIAASADDVEAIEPDDFEEEDQDATMVANTRGDANPLQAPPTFPQVSPAAGRSNAPAPSQNPTLQPQRPPPQRFGQTAALGQQAPPMLGPSGYPQQMQPPHMQPPHMHQQQQHQPPPPYPQHHGGPEYPFNETLGMPQGQISGPPHDPNDYGRPMSNAPHDFVPRSGPHPTGQSGEFIPRQSPRMAPTMNRMGAPTYDNRTMTAQRYKRRPPMWVVAALSCSIALLIAGVVIAIISSTNAPTTAKTTGSGSAATTAPSAAPVAAAGAATSGPFSTARAAFNTVVNQPGSSLAPSGAPPAAVTAPPPPTTAALPAEPVPATPAVAAPPPVTVAAAAPPPPVAVPVAAPPPPAPVARPSPPPAAAPVPVPAPKPAKPAALGAITVVCMPKCDQITDNGTPLGPGHIFNRPVPSGRHVLQLSAPNGARKNLVVEVAPEQTKEVRMSMDK